MAIIEQAAWWNTEPPARIANPFQRCETMKNDSSNSSAAFDAAVQEFKQLLGQLIARRWLATTPVSGATLHEPDQNTVVIEGDRDKQIIEETEL